MTTLGYCRGFPGSLHGLNVPRRLRLLRRGGRSQSQAGDGLGLRAPAEAVSRARSCAVGELARQEDEDDDVPFWEEAGYVEPEARTEKELRHRSEMLPSGSVPGMLDSPAQPNSAQKPKPQPQPPARRHSMPGLIVRGRRSSEKDARPEKPERPERPRASPIPSPASPIPSPAASDVARAPPPPESPEMRSEAPPLPDPWNLQQRDWYQRWERWDGIERSDMRSGDKSEPEACGAQPGITTQPQPFGRRLYCSSCLEAPLAAGASRTLH